LIPLVLKSQTVLGNCLAFFVGGVKIISCVMKLGLVIIIAIMLSGLSASSQPMGTISGYLKNPMVSQNAKDYYRHKFKVSDTVKTLSIIDSINTGNSTTRPFYLFLVCKMLQQPQYAPIEKLRTSIKNYTEQNPNYVLEFLKSKTIPKEYSVNWANSIGEELQLNCDSTKVNCIDSSLNRAAINCKPNNKHQLAKLYKIARDYYIECKVVDLIFALPEVKAECKYVETASKGKRHLGAFVNQKPTYNPKDSRAKYYWIKIWEDNGVCFVTHRHFFVNPKTMNILYLDTSTDSLMSLNVWRKKLKGKKSTKITTI